MEAKLSPKHRLVREDLRCCGGADGITQIPVPFFLKSQRTAQGESAFVETRRHLAGIAFLLLAVFFAVFLWGAVMWTLAGLWWIAIVPGALALACAYLFGAAMSARNIARRLVLTDKESLAIQTVDERGNVLHQTRSPIGECAISIHPVCLKQKDLPDFGGWLVRVAVVDHCFTLACAKEQRDILEYVQNSPSWIRSMAMTHGESLTVEHHDRWLGRPPKQYRKWW